MKILYLHQYFNTLEMTGGTRSYELAKRLVQRGHQVHIITSWRGETQHKTWFTTYEDGITVHWLPIAYSNKMSYQERVKVFIKFAYLANKKSLAIGGDIIFATSTPLTISIPAVFCSRSLKIPMIFEVRDLWPEIPIKLNILNHPLIKLLAGQLESWSYKNSTAIVALSPGMKKGILNKFPFPERIAVIPNASDIDFFQSNLLNKNIVTLSNFKENDKLVLYAGTFGKVNGVNYLLDLALELYRISSNVKILLVGKGAEFEAILRRAEVLGILNKQIFIEPSIQKKEMPSLLKLVDMASNLVIDKEFMFDNSANKFFDTLAAGKPIFINHGGWMKDLIEKNNCGYCSWRKSLNDVASDLNELLNNEALLREMSKNSFILAKDQFNRDIHAKQLESIFKKAINKEYNISTVTEVYYE